MTMSHSSKRRSFVLLAVLVITGSALLVATGALYMMQADVAAEAGVHRAAQSRALAWSGLQVVMQELHEQRQSLLTGRAPQLDSQYELHDAGPRVGAVRLVRDHADRLLTPEAGKIDLNQADAEMLSATGLVELELAESIITHRDQRRGGSFRSVAELLGVQGVTPELLYGPLDELTVMRDASGEEGDVVERIADRLDDQPVKGLADVMTVYGFEPVLQSSGALRIPLSLEWGEELARRCEQRYGDTVGSVQALFQADKMESDADIARVLRQTEVPVESWAELFDTFSTQTGIHQFGRLDINTASFEALRCLPGLEPEQVEQILRTRDRLSEEERMSIAWPVAQQIVDEESFEAIADRITTRCFTWRVRLAAGEVVAEDPDGPLLNPVLYEAVIDLSGPRSRLVYLREITLLDTAAQLASRDLAIESSTLDDPGRADAETEEMPGTNGFNGMEPDLDDSGFDSGGRSFMQESTGSDPDFPNETESQTDDSRTGSVTRRIGRFRSGSS